MEIQERSIFPIGQKNDAFARYFVGQSYLNMLTTTGVPIGNVTFEPGCRNNWHIHHAKTGGGQILLCTAGRPAAGQALARRRQGQLVCSSGGGGARHRDLQRVVRTGQRRRV